MKFNTIRCTIENGILTIVINRPASLNALSVETLDELEQAVAILYEDPAVKGALLTGEGKAFVAGADIRELAAMTPGEAHELSKRGQTLFARIENSPKPVVAAVNGFALGGGCELAMACHIRIASSAARFGQPEVNLGIVPGYGATQRLAQLTGKGKALELMLTGDMIDAHTALSIGLVNHIVEPDQLISHCQGLLQKIIAKAPIAIAKIIQAVNAGYESAAGYTTEAEAFLHCADTTDFKEGTDAFLNKRKPEFKGK